MDEVKKMLYQHDKEVKAKAIDEYAKALIERLNNEYLKHNDGTWNGAIDEAIKIANRLTEQLKEGDK